MGEKLIISDFYKNHLLGFHESDGKLKKIIDLNEDNIVGNIYCGYVTDVVKNINAAFVEFDGRKGFLPLGERTVPLHQGEKVLIQVAYDAMKTKDFGLTEHINLNQDSVVLTAGNTSISLSKKITDSAKRDDLKQLLEPYRNTEYGFILRTKAKELDDNKLLEEVETLIQRWKMLKQRFQFSTPKEPLLIHKKYISESLEFIAKYQGNVITDNHEIFNELSSVEIPCELYENRSVSLSNAYRLDKCMENALSTKVWLKSGAYLLIEYTEALTVIDVNTGKADFKANRQETFLKINREAALEIAKQMEIRNISGIVLIDFINLKDLKAQKELQQTLETELRHQSVPCFVFGFTKLGLMEISRKKKDKPLHECFKNQ